MRPTVFLCAPMGFAARYLLRTDVLTTLTANGVRVVALTPNPDEPYLQEELADDRVELAQLRVGWNDFGLVTRSRLWSAFFHLRQYTLAGGHRNSALGDKRAAFALMLRRRSRTAEALLRLGLAGLWRSRVLRSLLLRAESRRFSPDVHADLFARYRPNLVVTTSPGWFFPDAVLLREAAKAGVATATVVLSWDNPTSKGYRGASPDHMIVWSDEMARQVAEFHDYPRERISVAGVPHFDRYVRTDGVPSREDLYAELGLDPGRQTILFAGSSPTVFRDNVAVAETLARAVADDAFGSPAQLVLRPHPINFRPDHKAPLDDYRALAERHRHVHLNVPEIRSDRLQVDVSSADSVRLAGLITHSDVLVNVFSTTTLEAFLVDRPVVLVNWGRFREYEHVRSVLAEGAARVAGSSSELVENVRLYLDDPSLDRDARKRVATRELGPTDGQAGGRIGRRLLELLDRPPT